MNDVANDQDEDITGINITPLVDVCLVLLLIFMVTSSYFVKQLIPVTVPQAVTSRAESDENLTISMSPVGGYAINEIPIKKEAIANEIRREIKTTGIRYVLIRADERTPHGEVERIMKISKRAGASRIAFATVPKA